MSLRVRLWARRSSRRACSSSSVSRSIAVCMSAMWCSLASSSESAATRSGPTASGEVCRKRPWLVSSECRAPGCAARIGLAPAQPLGGHALRSITVAPGPPPRWRPITGVSFRQAHSGQPSSHPSAAHWRLRPHWHPWLRPAPCRSQRQRPSTQLVSTAGDRPTMTSVQPTPACWPVGAPAFSAPRANAAAR